MAEGLLGRRTPTDWTHVERYPLSALSAAETPTGVPVAIGINWYTNFDTPVRKTANGRWWIGLDPTHLGTVRGGHCVCVKSVQTDWTSWWDFYDQGSEGACVGFGSSRMMTLLNRHRLYARWLWDKAKIADGWSDTNPGDDEGTSVAAAMDVLRTQGHVRWSDTFGAETWQRRDTHVATGSEGIAANRWATTVDEVHAAIALPLADSLGAVPILNSWGRSYPHMVWMPDATLARMIHEDGEIALVTDR